MSGFENQQGLCSEDLEDSRKQRPHSYSAHVKSHMFWVPEQSERSLGQTHLLILKSLLEMQEATGTPPGGRDPGSIIWGRSFHHNKVVLPRAILEPLLWPTSSRDLARDASKPAPPEPPRATQSYMGPSHSPAGPQPPQEAQPSSQESRRPDPFTSARTVVGLPPQKRTCNPYRAAPLQRT